MLINKEICFVSYFNIDNYCLWISKKKKFINFSKIKNNIVIDKIGNC